MKTNELKGKRVKLTKMDDKYTSLTNGDMGTIKFIDDIGQIHVNWDKGSTLSLIPEIDEYEIIDTPVLESKFNKLMMFESFNLKNSFSQLEETIENVKKIVKDSFIKMNYEPNMKDYQATLDLFFEDGNNTQGIIFEIDLVDNVITERGYVRSSNPGDLINEEPNDTHFRSLSELLKYIKDSTIDYVKVEESKRYGKFKK